MAATTTLLTDSPAAPVIDTAPAAAADERINALVYLLDLRDNDTADHSDAVADLAVQLGRRIGLPARRLGLLREAARLHDLGKIGVPDRILYKQGPLDADEWAVMRRHPVWGAEAIGAVPGFEEVASTVRFHHERWDGDGYPDGLNGEGIPIEARILAVCDSLCALTADRPYRRAMTPSGATRVIAEASGDQFDPAVVKALIAVAASRPNLGLSAPNAVETPAEREPHAEAEGRTSFLNALDAVDEMPVLTESLNSMVRLLDAPGVAVERIADAVETDPALTARVLRAACEQSERKVGPGGVPEAIELLGREGLRELAREVPVYDFFEQPDGWRVPLESFRLHAVATSRAIGRLARVLGRKDADELAAAALLHDVGKMVLAKAHRNYPGGVHGSARTPQERAQAERRAFGIDHAGVSGLVLGRWGLPQRIVDMVSGHHDDEATGTPDALLLRLADALAHQQRGDQRVRGELLRVAKALSLTANELRSAMLDVPDAPARRERAVPCPLTSSEVAVLGGVSGGRTVGQIAAERSVSVSTVRGHLHNAYRKMDVGDRTQAVLLARQRGWVS